MAFIQIYERLYPDRNLEKGGILFAYLATGSLILLSYM